MVILWSLGKHQWALRLWVGWVWSSQCHLWKACWWRCSSWWSRASACLHGWHAQCWRLNIACRCGPFYNCLWVTFCLNTCRYLFVTVFVFSIMSKELKIKTHLMESQAQKGKHLMFTLMWELQKQLRSRVVKGLEGERGENKQGQARCWTQSQR